MSFTCKAIVTILRHQMSWGMTSRVHCIISKDSYRVALPSDRMHHWGGWAWKSSMHHPGQHSSVLWLWPMPPAVWLWDSQPSLSYWLPLSSCLLVSSFDLKWVAHSSASVSLAAISSLNSWFSRGVRVGRRALWLWWWCAVGSRNGARPGRAELFQEACLTQQLHQCHWDLITLDHMGRMFPAVALRSANPVPPLQHRGHISGSPVGYQRKSLFMWGSGNQTICNHGPQTKSKNGCAFQPFSHVSCPQPISYLVPCF
jgi:hypothetical protein